MYVFMCFCANYYAHESAKIFSVIRTRFDARALDRVNLQATLY